MRKLDVLIAVYSYPASAAVNASAAVVYYLLFTFMIRSQNSNTFIVTAPAYLIYALILTASVLLTINFYSLRFVLPGIRRNASWSAASALTASAGGIVAGCAACEFPFIANALYFLGYNALAVSGFVYYVARYQSLILAALTLANVALAYYSVAKLSGECKISGGRLSKR